MGGITKFPPGIGAGIKKNSVIKDGDTNLRPRPASLPSLPAMVLGFTLIETKAIILLVVAGDLHSRPATHHATVVPEADVVTISADKYQRLLTTQSSPAVTTLAQISASIACTAFQSPWVINSGAFPYMINASSIMSDVYYWSSISCYPCRDIYFLFFWFWYC
ncbi:hypothetical protein Acr_00g0100790 [Actinidia rufa]|uniref:Uncharacterized protein n=1 Tax=Actinidia rufa TaxID=165716 RepID=A0A7J0DZV8_9ERIC|nr:hypothetical protein Acr_00g0100790 [Actinidia rufa]